MRRMHAHRSMVDFSCVYYYRECSAPAICCCLFILCCVLQWVLCARDLLFVFCCVSQWVLCARYKFLFCFVLFCFVLCCVVHCSECSALATLFYFICFIFFFFFLVINVSALRTRHAVFSFFLLLMWVFCARAISFCFPQFFLLFSVMLELTFSINVHPPSALPRDTYDGSHGIEAPPTLLFNSELFRLWTSLCVCFSILPESHSRRLSIFVCKSRFRWWDKEPIVPTGNGKVQAFRNQMTDFSSDISQESKLREQEAHDIRQLARPPFYLFIFLSFYLFIFFFVFFFFFVCHRCTLTRLCGDETTRDSGADLSSLPKCPLLNRSAVSCSSVPQPDITLCRAHRLHSPTVVILGPSQDASRLLRSLSHCNLITQAPLH